MERIRDGKESLEEALTVFSARYCQEKKQLEQLLSLAKQANQQFIDAKAEQLFESSYACLVQDADAKIIIFT